MTNADRIRSMTDEELARMLLNVELCPGNTVCDKDGNFCASCFDEN